MNSILWDDASGTKVVKPCESARLPGESDNDFLTRIAAAVVPQGVTYRVVADADIAKDAGFVAAEAFACSKAITDAKAFAKQLALSMNDPSALLVRAGFRLVFDYLQEAFGKINEIAAKVSVDPLPATTWSELLPEHAAKIDAETNPLN